MIVLHLVKTSCGATWALRQMKELVKLGIEVHVALPYNGENIPKYHEYGIVTHEIEYNVQHSYSTINKLQDLAQKLQPAIIHSHFYITTMFMRLAFMRNKTPRIFQVPGPLHLEHGIFRSIDILTAQSNDIWIGSCKWTKNLYKSYGIDDSRIYLSYYGTDIHDIKYEKGKLRRLLQVDKDAIIIAMVSYMYAPKKYLGQRRGLKGHEDFIDAMAILLKKYKNMYAVCIGGAWGNAMKYENNIVKYGMTRCGEKFKYLGTRKDVPELYQDIDVVVHPSHSENLGGAAESLLLKVPTIATNVGGFPDIITNYQTGLLVDKKDPNQIVKAIEYMMNNKKHKEQMVKKGYTNVSMILNVKNSSYEIYSIYKEILKKYGKA